MRGLTPGSMVVMVPLMCFVLHIPPCYGARMVRNWSYAAMRSQDSAQRRHSSAQSFII
jgi:hypothetical protein